jgi:hypothetical protein
MKKVVTPIIQEFFTSTSSTSSSHKTVDVSILLYALVVPFSCPHKLQLVIEKTNNI